MKSAAFGLRVAGTIFGIVGLIHLLRILTLCDVVIAGSSLPVWINFAGLGGAAFLCIWLWRLSYQKSGNQGKYVPDKHIYP